MQFDHELDEQISDGDVHFYRIIREVLSPTSTAQQHCRGVAKTHAREVIHLGSIFVTVYPYLYIFQSKIARDIVKTAVDAISHLETM